MAWGFSQIIRRKPPLSWLHRAPGRPISIFRQSAFIPRAATMRWPASAGSSGPAQGIIMHGQHFLIMSYLGTPSHPGMVIFPFDRYKSAGSSYPVGCCSSPPQAVRYGFPLAYRPGCVCVHNRTDKPSVFFTYSLAITVGTWTSVWAFRARPVHLPWQHLCAAQ